MKLGFLKCFFIKDKEEEKVNKSIEKEAYDIWLSKYLDQGGVPTHFYNYNLFLLMGVMLPLVGIAMHI